MNTLVMLFCGFPKVDENDELIKHTDTINEFILNSFNDEKISKLNYLERELKLNNISIEEYMKIPFEKITIYSDYINKENEIDYNDLYICYNQTLNEIIQSLKKYFYKKFLYGEDFIFIKTKQNYLPYLKFYYSINHNELSKYTCLHNKRLVISSDEEIFNKTDCDDVIFFVDVDVNKYNEDLINSLIKENKYDEINKQIIKDPNELVKFIWKY